jgi:hypothetical protein
MGKDVRMKRWLIAIASAFLLLLLAGAPLTPLAAQNQFPANAVIRGENIRVRAEPAANAVDNAILQRGEPIILTGDLEAHPEGEFYPVQVPTTGATGWILWLFIDPTSIVPAAPAPAPAPAAEPTVAPVVEPPEVVVDVPPAEPAPPAAEPAPPAAEPAPPEDESGRRNRDRPDRQQEPPADAVPERVVVSGDGAITSDPFTLVAGQYRVSASMTVEAPTGFTAVLNGPNQFSQALFNETIDTPQEWSAETEVTIAEAGEYTVNVADANTSWRIRFLPA